MVLVLLIGTLRFPIFDLLGHKVDYVGQLLADVTLRPCHVHKQITMVVVQIVDWISHFAPHIVVHNVVTRNLAAHSYKAIKIFDNLLVFTPLIVDHLIDYPGCPSEHLLVRRARLIHRVILRWRHKDARI